MHQPAEAPTLAVAHQLCFSKFSNQLLIPAEAPTLAVTNQLCFSKFSN